MLDVEASSARPPLGFWRRAARNFAAHGARAPLGLPLAKLRRRAARRALERHATRTAELVPGLRSGDASARHALAQVADRALCEMRSEVHEQAERAGFGRGWAASVDAWWRGTNEPEYLDDPELDRGMRVRIVEHLDKMNDLFGSYGAFFQRLVPWLDATRPTRVLDLAAGHGGFSLAAAELARGHGAALDVTASDIRREYLELGAARALELGLNLNILVQDALDLSNLEPGAYDVITCTQSLHHFGAGEVAVMFSEAGRIAARGVSFIDGARSALNAAMIAGIGLLVYRDRAFAHDTVVSFRRFFVPEELELLARLGPWGNGACAEWIPPGHCVLELQTARGVL
jgi:2-polyprenyl-3-methyl-5-hydroxy-6-metoxy-1,4-benzoquinol methylase